MGWRADDRRSGPWSCLSSCRWQSMSILHSLPRLKNTAYCLWTAISKESREQPMSINSRTQNPWKLFLPSVRDDDKSTEEMLNVPALVHSRPRHLSWIVVRNIKRQRRWLCYRPQKFASSHMPVYSKNLNCQQTSTIKIADQKHDV